MRKLILAGLAALTIGTGAFVQPADAACWWNGFAWRCHPQHSAWWWRHRRPPVAWGWRHHWHPAYGGGYGPHYYSWWGR